MLFERTKAVGQFKKEVIISGGKDKEQEELTRELR